MTRAAEILPYPPHRRASLAARVAAAAALLPVDGLELLARVAEALARPFARRPDPAA